MLFGKLYLIPSPLGEVDFSTILPSYYSDIVNQIKHFIVEDVRTARRFLIKLGISTPINDLVFFELNKHTQSQDLPEYLKPLLDGMHIGLLSEAGCPGVADPGAMIVKLAHEKNIEVVPLTGPSSILLALMASGLNGQNFAFNGYLPVKKEERAKMIRHFENRSAQENQTEIFIETPYRNNHLLNDILQYCQPSTQLCIAADLTTPAQFIKTMPVGNWKNQVPELDKKPAVFLILAAVRPANKISKHNNKRS